MTIFNLEKYKKNAKNLIGNSILVVGGEEYDIVTAAIHINSLSYQDPFTNTKNRVGKSWFIFSDKYIRYVDFDLSEEDIKGGIRINGIKNRKTGIQYSSAGKVYDHLKEVIGKNNFLKLNGISPTKKNSPDLYLTKRSAKLNKRIYEMPRHGKFKAFRNISKATYYYMFFPLMFTSNYEYLRDETSKVLALPHILYLYMYDQHDWLIKEGIITQKLLDKYLRYLIKSNSSDKEIHKRVGNRYFKVEDICGLFKNYAQVHIK